VPEKVVWLLTSRDYVSRREISARPSWPTLSDSFIRSIPTRFSVHAGALRDCRYLLHDRDTKYTQSFRAIIASGRVEPLVLPACSPNLNAYAERWVRSVKEECLCKVILFGERSLRRALSEYVEHFHAERNHQGKGNVLLFPRSANTRRDGPVQCRERLGGLLRYYHQEAA
jgi:putative transposase